MRLKTKHSAGFTLIEVLIAVAIMAFLMGVAFSALTKIIETKKILDDRRDSTAVINAVLSRVVRELQLAYGKRAILPTRKNLNAAQPAKLSFKGSARSDGEYSTDSITFLAQEGGQYLPDGGTHSGLVQISYRLEKAPADQPEYKYFLVREEVPVIRPYEKAYKKAMIFPVSHDVVSLKFRYMSKDKDKWEQSWGKGENMELPALVKLSITVRSKSGLETSYTTIVALRS